MLSSPDNQRILLLLVLALIVSTTFGVSLEGAKFQGEALGAQFYIGGPVAAYLVQLIMFYKFHLFDQNLIQDKKDLLNHPIETLSSIEDIENIIIDLKGQKERITNKINRLEEAKNKFNESSTDETFATMGMRPARRGG